MAKLIDSNDFMTVEQVAEKLAVTVFKVRELLRQKKLKGFKKLNRWYVFTNDLTDFIKT